MFIIGTHSYLSYGWSRRCMTCRRQKPLSEQGHRKTETLGLKAHQAWEGRLILSLRRLLLCFRNISHGSGRFEGNDGEKMPNDQWCHYYGSLVSVTVSSQQRSALSISSRVQKCMLADMSGHRKKLRANITGGLTDSAEVYSCKNIFNPFVLTMSTCKSLDTLLQWQG